MPRAGVRLPSPVEPRGLGTAATELIQKYPGHPLSHPGWRGAGPEARICPRGARTLTRTPRGGYGRPGQQLAERRRAPPATSEPVRLLAARLRALSEGSRARRSAAAGRSRAVPKRQALPAVRVPAGRCPPREPPESRNRTAPRRDLPAGRRGPSPRGGERRARPPAKAPGSRECGAQPRIPTPPCTPSTPSPAASLSNPAPRGGGGLLPATAPPATTGIAKQRPPPEPLPRLKIRTLNQRPGLFRDGARLEPTRHVLFRWESGVFRCLLIKKEEGKKKKKHPANGSPSTPP